MQDLRRIRALDPLTAWAVGESGTILHTVNGGATWKPQTSPIAGRFFALEVLDARHAWAGGLTAL